MTPTNQTDAQMKLADVTQADRDLWKYLLDAPKSQCTMMDTCDPATDELQAIARHRLATEARAQGLVELLEMMDGIGYKELNLSNYTHDDVCALNNAYVEMQLILTQALATWRRT